jgi:N-acetylmuramoyl-L-alanine amidase
MKINANHFAEGVKVIPTPNKSGSIVPELIIVHDTAGQLDYMTSVEWLCNPQAKASAHFVIGRKGEIVQLASCLVRCWHAGVSSYHGRSNVNAFAIGVEFANPGKLRGVEGSPLVRADFGKTYDIKAYGVEYKETPQHGRGFWMPYTEAQLTTGFALCMAIKEKYNITSCAPHWEISPGRKIDTNPLFPLERLRSRLIGRGDDDTHPIEVSLT